MPVNQKLIELKIKRLLDKLEQRTANPAQARAFMAEGLAEIIVQAIRQADVTVAPGQAVSTPAGPGATTTQGKGKLR